jgi:hypothetical protein
MVKPLSDARPIVSGVPSILTSCSRPSGPIARRMADGERIAGPRRPS